MTTLEGAPFVVKTYQLVCDPSNDKYVNWSEGKDSFIVEKPIEFAHEILPKYFKHNNFCSFIRQLNTYGFHKVESKQWEFKHELFKEGNTHLLKEIIRRKAKKREAQETQVKIEPNEDLKTPNGGEEEIDDEVERLKGMNNILMREVLRLQKQQESTQGTVQKILDELIDSRKAQQKLEAKVRRLSTSRSTTSPESVLSDPTLLHTPESPYSPSSFLPPSPSYTPSPSYSPNSEYSPNGFEQKPLDTIGFEAEAGSLGLDELAHLELTSPDFEQEFAKFFQNSMPPSPQYQTGSN